MTSCPPKLPREGAGGSQKRPVLRHRTGQDRTRGEAQQAAWQGHGRCRGSFSCAAVLPDQPTPNNTWPCPALPCQATLGQGDGATRSATSEQSKSNAYVVKVYSNSHIPTPTWQLAPRAYINGGVTTAPPHSSMALPHMYCTLYYYCRSPCSCCCSKYCSVDIRVPPPTQQCAKTRSLASLHFLSAHHDYLIT